MSCCGKIVVAAAGWIDAIIDPATPQLIETRRAVCRRCDRVKRRNLQRVDRPTMGLTTFSTCGECKCPIAIATANRDKSCPLGKWPGEPNHGRPIALWQPRRRADAQT